MGIQVSFEIDYEIAQYEAYSETARCLVNIGEAREARLFETVAEICYHKATVLQQLVAMIVDENYSYNASLNLYPGFLQQEPMPTCGDIDYEVERYDTYATYANVFREMQCPDESSILTSLADLCYQKAEILSRVQAVIETGKRHNPSP